MEYAEILIGGISLIAVYTYDPGRPASGPYAPEYPTLEIEDIKDKRGLSLFELVEDLGALPELKQILLRNLEEKGYLR